MDGQRELQKLLETLSPTLEKEKYVFASISKARLKLLGVKPKLVFFEKEGAAVVLDKETADNERIAYDGAWALITLRVHSSLFAVGLLAAAAGALAKNKISVNAVSAFYHDHLFVPFEKAGAALMVLKKLQANARKKRKT